MSRFHRILCPVDLSENSLAAVELASTIAKQENSRIVFLYVKPDAQSDRAIQEGESNRTKVNSEKELIAVLQPSKREVECECLFRRGNAGPEVVRESKRCDTIVMSSHGFGGMHRLLMGNVAQYTMKNAACPVILIRIPDLKRPLKNQEIPTTYVTEVMHLVAPIHEHDNIELVMAELKKVNETAAPVIDPTGIVIGVLTATDIAQYFSLQERFENKDPTVLREMFEVDDYGQVRPVNQDFYQVKRHMSSPVVTILNTETTDRALEMFTADSTIHHLVVVDEDQRPLGIVEPNHCNKKPECIETR